MSTIVRNMISIDDKSLVGNVGSKGKKESMEAVNMGFMEIPFSVKASTSRVNECGKSRTHPGFQAGVQEAIALCAC